MSILQELYDSEINATIEWFWDGGFDLNLGDGMNGFVAKGCALSWAEAEDWLEHEAIKHYPDSVFAKSRKSAA